MNTYSLMKSYSFHTCPLVFPPPRVQVPKTHSRYFWSYLKAGPRSKGTIKANSSTSLKLERPEFMPS